MKNIQEVIAGYAAVESFNSDVYQDLVTNAVHSNVPDKDTWDLYCKPAETQYMVENHGTDDAARKKSGEWKFRAYLPGSYTSAKCVVGNALDQGIPLLDEHGVPLGKSALQTKINEAKADAKEEKSALEKVEIMMESICKVYVKADPDEWDDMRTAIIDVYNRL